MRGDDGEGGGGGNENLCRESRAAPRTRHAEIRLET